MTVSGESVQLENPSAGLAAQSGCQILHRDRDVIAQTKIANLRNPRCGIRHSSALLTTARPEPWEFRADQTRDVQRRPFMESGRWSARIGRFRLEWRFLDAHTPSAVPKSGDLQRESDRVRSWRCVFCEAKVRASDYEHHS